VLEVEVIGLIVLWFEFHDQLLNLGLKFALLSSIILALIEIVFKISCALILFLWDLYLLLNFHLNFLFFFLDIAIFPQSLI
jgi:hypothetical protein